MRTSGPGRGTAPGSGSRAPGAATCGSRWDGRRNRAPSVTRCGDPGPPERQDDGKRGPRGDDAGKQRTGRQRHVLVDTEGILAELVVHPAHRSERAGARLVLAKAKAAGRRLGTVWVDGGDKSGLVAWAGEELGSAGEVVGRPAGATGFVRLPRRWVVERSFAWAGRSRRLSKDYEAGAETSEGMIWAAFGGTMLRRLVRRTDL